MFSSKYIIVYKSEAVEDLKEIMEWYETISEQVTDNFIIALALAELDLMKYPNAFASLNYNSFRRKILKGFPFKMIYKIDKINKEVIVFAILHTARSNRFIKSQLKK